jgi:hypothetical protein
MTMPEPSLHLGQRRHVAAAIEELEAGFAEVWPDDKVTNIEQPGWMHFAQALDHLRDIEREASRHA